MLKSQNTASFLFVYGTLMQGFSNPFAKKLAQNAVWCGKGSFPGYLFDLGAYPGAVYQQDTTDTVQGEVWQLSDFQSTIKALDWYEGINEKAPEYERSEIPVLLENRDKITCWVYLFRQSTESFKVIPDGDYRKWTTITKQHL